MAARAKWQPSDPLDQTLDVFAGDVVQALQALKETKPARSPALAAELQDVLTQLVACQAYCREGAAAAASPAPLRYPFARAARAVRDSLASLAPADQAPPPPLLPAASSADDGTGSSSVAIALPAEDESAVQTFELGPYRMPRLFNGLWQMSSTAWGSSSAEAQEEALRRLVAAGLTATDMADHYVRSPRLF